MKAIKQKTVNKWTGLHNLQIIRLYEKFLDFQQSGTKYQKAKHVRELAEKQNRSKGSIECKLMNVSAIYKELGLSVVDGYKPLSNYSKSLRDSVLRFINKK